MPTLNIQGKRVKVDDSFLSLPPDQQEATVEEIASSFGPAAPEVSVGEDVAKAIPSGLAKGAIGLAGLPAAISDAGTAAGDWLTKKVYGDGADDVLSALNKGRASSNFNLPRADEVQKSVESVTGDFYDPQTIPGKFAGTVAEFAPGGATAGIGKGARAVAKGIGKFGVAPGLASEAAGQATKDSAAEPYARAGAAILAGGGAASLDDSLRQSAGARAAPTNAALRATKDAAYKAANDSGLIVTPEALDRTVTKLVQRATTEGFHPDQHKSLHSALKTLYEDSIMAQPLDRVEIMRRFLGNAASSLDKNERRISKILINEFDDAIENLGPTDILAGDVAAGTSALKEARATYSRLRKSEQLDEAVTKGERRAASTGSGGNADNAIRQNVRAILDNPARRRGFTSAEIEALEKVVKGTPIQNALRGVGKLSPQGSGLMAMLGIGGAAVNPMLAIPALAGALAKPTANAMTRNNKDLASALIRSGGRGKNVAIEDRRTLALALSGSQPLRSE